MLARRATNPVVMTLLIHMKIAEDNETERDRGSYADRWFQTLGRLGLCQQS